MASVSRSQSNEQIPKPLQAPDQSDASLDAIKFPENKDLENVKLGIKQKLLFIASGILERNSSEGNYDVIFTHSNTDAQIMLGALPNKNKKQKEAIEKRKDSEGNQRTDSEGIQRKTFFLHVNEPWELLKNFFGSKAYTKEEWGDHQHWIEAKDHVELSSLQLHKAAVQIHEQLEQGIDVYVHCRAGVGRSAMAVAAYLIKYQGMSVAEASKLIKNHRAKSTIFNKIPSLVDFAAEVNKNNHNFNKEIELVDALVAKEAVYKQSTLARLVDKIAVKVGIKTQKDLDQKKLDYEKKQIENFDYQKAKQKYEKKHKKNGHKLYPSHFHAYKNKYITLKPLLDTITEGKNDRELNFKLSTEDLSKITQALSVQSNDENLIDRLIQATQLLSEHFELSEFEALKAIVLNNKNTLDTKNEDFKKTVIEILINSFYEEKIIKDLNANSINQLYSTFFIEPKNAYLIKNLFNSIKILRAIFPKRPTEDHYLFILSNNSKFSEITKETKKAFQKEINFEDIKNKQELKIILRSVILFILFNEEQEDILDTCKSHIKNLSMLDVRQDDYARKTKFNYTGILNNEDNIKDIIINTDLFLKSKKKKLAENYLSEIEIEE